MEPKDKLPDNHVMAVIDGHQEAEAAAADLRTQGFESTRLLRGDDITREVDPKAERSTGIAKAVKALQDHFSEEFNYLAQYQEEARAGHDVVAVLVRDPEQADSVREILENHGARNVRFFGRLAITDMSPESNPTTRSEESPERRNWTDWSNL
ncbi:MAG TPA: hypothetical protein VNN10_02935 [Dehalococcoidia bacterium]|nr:hypothetical protein [Dehalococcoidia bacterium]